ncbi:hypothetical protein Cylst_5209 [Cylindrospermum stagnale PCC 7417]|uniref:Uncharacterized protein n=1 Tax=Cylindrospermum stagnale PCC 7417 TaxID=56107 RepID=K9X564_9NOST|nr:hypothetical protein [Cylindrospermum stagnale]AFZ27244.1 hypothetical protein Cylst_5209 [Cylindrospermum stagnale PCC 7417]
MTIGWEALTTEEKTALLQQIFQSLDAELKATVIAEMTKCMDLDTKAKLVAKLLGGENTTQIVIGQNQTTAKNAFLFNLSSKEQMAEALIVVANVLKEDS